MTGASARPAQPTAAHPGQPLPEVRWTSGTDYCPHPERWNSTDSDSTEIEVTELVAWFVRALQPDFVIETGSAWGQTSEAIGRALRANGQGHLFTLEVDPERIAATAERCVRLPVTVVHEDSLAWLARTADAEPEFLVSVGFAWLDSALDSRVMELMAIRPMLARGAIVGIHDAGYPGKAKHHQFSLDVDRAASVLGFERISLPTPRGVTFLQWV